MFFFSNSPLFFVVLSLIVRHYMPQPTVVSVHFICLLYGFTVTNLQVGILKRVLEEVEKVMHEFRGMLYKSMEDPHLDLAEVSILHVILTVRDILKLDSSVDSKSLNL